MQFSFSNVELTQIGTHLPTHETTSQHIEDQLSPLYQRLGLVPGRLELLTGIKARRFFPQGTRPSDIAIAAANNCLKESDRSQIDCLIFASVCRNFVEPATASVVHQALGLPATCLTFDLSNACLGWINGIAMASTLVEQGIVRQALVVSGEDAREVVETTIAKLNSDLSITRQSLKPSIATLTLGSAGVAALISQRNDGVQILGGVFHTASQFNQLCIGGVSAENLQMNTDSETMLNEGVALAGETWKQTREFLGWGPQAIDCYLTHQVGHAHQKLLFERLELDPKKDFPIYPILGNTGSAAIGLALARALEQKVLKKNSRAVLLGIGSGLVCGMIGVRV